MSELTISTSDEAFTTESSFLEYQHFQLIKLVIKKAFTKGQPIVTLSSVIIELFPK